MFSEITFQPAPDNQATCVICLEDFDSSDCIVATRCNHLFHKIHLEGWITKCVIYPSCPVCRADLRSWYEQKKSQIINLLSQKKVQMTIVSGLMGVFTSALFGIGSNRLFNQKYYLMEEVLYITSAGVSTALVGFTHSDAFRRISLSDSIYSLVILSLISYALGKGGGTSLGIFMPLFEGLMHPDLWINTGFFASCMTISAISRFATKKPYHTYQLALSAVINGLFFSYFGVKEGLAAAIITSLGIEAGDTVAFNYLRFYQRHVRILSIS